MPNIHAGFERWLLELDFVKESAFKGLVHILNEVGGGDKDTVKVLHLLKDNVLDGVFHFVR